MYGLPVVFGKMVRREANRQQCEKWSFLSISETNNTVHYTSCLAKNSSRQTGAFTKIDGYKPSSAQKQDHHHSARCSCRDLLKAGQVRQVKSRKEINCGVRRITETKEDNIHTIYTWTKHIPSSKTVTRSASPGLGFKHGPAL